MVALTILVILLAALYSGFDVAQRAWSEESTTQKAESSLRLAMDELGAELRSAVHAKILLDARPAPYFFGGSDSLRFLTADPAPLLGELVPGVVEVTWKIDLDETTPERGLVVERALPEEMQPLDERVFERIEIAPLVVRLRLRYFFHPPVPEDDLEAEEGSWTEVWDPEEEDPMAQPSRLPEGVEVSLSYFDPARGDTIALPPQYAPIRAKTPLIRNRRPSAGAGFETLGEFR
jgi:type II secretory pathway pseudopilin PulG